MSDVEGQASEGRREGLKNQERRGFAMNEWQEQIRKRLAGLKLAPLREVEIVEELAQHLDDRYRELLSGGASEDEARRMALEELSDEELLAKGLRRVEQHAPQEVIVPGGGSSHNFLAGAWQDIRYGLRQLRRNPGFTVVAVLTLALGIGATSAIFSVVYGVLLRPLPYPKPDRIVSISEVASDGHMMGFTEPNFRDLRAMNRTLSGMALCKAMPATVTGPSGPSRVFVALVSADFFRVMRVAPFRGRNFSAEELRQGGRPAALASYGYWRQELGALDDLSRSKVTVEGHAVSVVGVLPPGFDYPARAEFWVPAEMFGSESSSRTAHNWSAAVARLRDGVTVAQARDDLSMLAHRLHQEFKPEIDMTGASVEPLRSALTARVRPALLILLAAVGFLLLVACANVANLLLARAAARRRELAVRAALGAGRARLVRQLLTESWLLALTGGALGVLLAFWGVEALLALAPPGLPRMGEVSVDLPVLGFTLGTSILVAVGLGILTALRSTAIGPQAALAEGSRGATSSRSSRRTMRVLIGGQVAVTLALLAGAGLLGRSLLRVLSVDPGFRTSHIVSMELEVPNSSGSSSFSLARSRTDMRPARFMDTLFGRLRALPGVEEVGGVSDLPLAEGGPCSNGKFLLLDREPDFNFGNSEDVARLERLWTTAPGGDADYCVASAGYFKALGIPLLSGRLFNDGDNATAPHAALISESLARLTWPGRNPLGRTIEFGNMDGDLRLLSVVGVVGDVRSQTIEKPPDPTVYVNYRQLLHSGRDFTVVMRSSAPPAVLLAGARRIIRDLAPGVAPRFETFQDVFSASLRTRRFNLTLVSIFAMSALLLAAGGIFGMMAYWVSRRTNEIGTRMALGAERRDVLRMVIGQGLKLALIGVVIGIAGALALTRFLASLLYGVKPTDPLTFIVVSLVLIAVALAACYIPARRAAKVDPMVALRHE